MNIESMPLEEFRAIVMLIFFLSAMGTLGVLPLILAVTMIEPIQNRERMTLKLVRVGLAVSPLVTVLYVIFPQWKHYPTAAALLAFYGFTYVEIFRAKTEADR